jgi:uncharacterized membrane protein
MSNLPLHPAIVHVPLGLAFVIPLVAIAIAVAVRAGRLQRGAFGVVLGLQILLVGGGLVAMKLGERDEHRVEAVVSERLIEAHEERAEAFLWVAGVVLAGAAALLVVPGRTVGVVSAVVAAGTLAVAALAVRTGEAGGELVYVQGAAAAWAPASSGGAVVPARHGGERDDD